MDVECGKCGKMVSATKVKVDTANQWYVCNDCVADEVAAKEKERYQHQKLQERNDMTSKVRIKCNNCGFGYLYDTWKQYPKNCPNCNVKTPGVK